MEEQKKSIASYMERLKQKTSAQKHYGGDIREQSAIVDVHACPACGAGRAKQDGLTHCAYCGHEFIGVSISKGLHLDKNDNSRK